MNLNCVICAELFSQSDNNYVTNCGHIFHYVCIAQWLERSKTCPQCRQKCYPKDIHRIYFNVANVDSSKVDIGSLQQQLDNAALQNNILQKDLKEAQEEIKSLKEVQKNCRKTIANLEKRFQSEKFLVDCLNKELKVLREENKMISSQKEEIQSLKSYIELLESVQTVLKSTTEEVDRMVKGNNKPKTLCVWVTTLKRELKISENKRTDLRNTLKLIQDNLRAEQETVRSLEKTIARLASENHMLSEKLKSVEDIKEETNSKRNRDDNVPKKSPSFVNKMSSEQELDTASPGTLHKMKEIEESDSPYLRIKSSSVGLTPLMKLGEKHKSKGENEIRKSVLNSTFRKSREFPERYSIFKKPRLTAHSGTSKTYNLVSTINEGEKSPPSMLKGEPEKFPTSLSERIKSGKLKKLQGFV